MIATEHLYPVILAGGSGTRFWPLSRHLYPKQLLRIIGEETLIQQTMRRVLSCAKPDQVIISTNPGQADSIRVQLGEWKSHLKDNYVIEPVGRNTAPAIALVAGELIRRDPEAMMLVLPADHVVTGEKAFQAAVDLGMELADKGHLVRNQTDEARDRVWLHSTESTKRPREERAADGPRGRAIR
jgi:mannose-1-phosphate guanylyltransferase/mannose-6-phosphate isomerase